MKDLVAVAEKIAAKLIERRQTIAVAESSTGGLISAALLAVPGASAYFLGSAVVYTRDARRILMDIPDGAMKGIRSASEVYAQLLAGQIRQRFASDWGLSETGATGPTGNRYGDAAGHSCMATAGLEQTAMTLETGSPDRLANMHVFAEHGAEFPAAKSFAVRRVGSAFGSPNERSDIRERMRCCPGYRVRSSGLRTANTARQKVSRHCERSEAIYSFFAAKWIASLRSQ